LRDKRDPRVELPSIPTPEVVYEAEVEPGDQDRHRLRGIGVGDTPDYVVLAGQRGEGGAELLALQPEAFAFYL
jgi:hypothetical protein